MNAGPSIEERLRTHLAAERHAIRPPDDIEARVMRRLQQAPPVEREPGILRQLVLTAALVILAAGLAFGIWRLRTAPPGPIGPTPTPSVSTTATSTPTASPIASPRPATAVEYDGMVAVGKPAAEQQLSIPDCGATSPGPGHDCFTALAAADAIVGTDAGYFHGARFGTGCWVYLYQDTGGWHFVDVRCAQGPGSLPRVAMDDLVHVSGCANVRAEPSLQAPVVACLPNNTTVRITGGPVYREGKLWWYLEGRGWMVHDSLVS